MTGKLLAQARKDALKFVTSGGFEDDITITSPDGTNVLAFTGWVSGRWQSFVDDNGRIVASASNHVNIPESVLTAAEYPVRSETTGKVKLEGHKIQANDNNGVVWKFVIDKCYPNSTTGLIMCILGQSK
jgi:hypothetical protein